MTPLSQSDNDERQDPRTRITRRSVSRHRCRCIFDGTLFLALTLSCDNGLNIDRDPFVNYASHFPWILNFCDLIAFGGNLLGILVGWVDKRAAKVEEGEEELPLLDDVITVNITPSPIILPTADISNLTKFLSVTQLSIIPILAVYGVFVSSSNGESIPKKAPVSPSRSELPFPTTIHYVRHPARRPSTLSHGSLYHLRRFGASLLSPALSVRSHPDPSIYRNRNRRNRKALSLGGTALGRERDSLIKRWVFRFEHGRFTRGTPITLTHSRANQPSPVQYDAAVIASSLELLTFALAGLLLLHIFWSVGFSSEGFVFGYPCLFGDFNSPAGR
ncbi:hypothetical protein C8J56DRAFT_897341 [Mycena floridula]|nr:hypothetical protein C8J56DRAFT_897341 [Mycena floridula]